MAGWPDRETDHVAFVEGTFVLGGEEATPSLWKLLERLPALKWVAVQMAVAALFAALARAPRLGRPRPDPPSGADRPAAHAEALGALLEASRATKESLDLLDRYRVWRRGHAARVPAPGRPRSLWSPGHRIRPGPASCGIRGEGAGGEIPRNRLIPIVIDRSIENRRQ